jgi:hypothetical protein
MRPVTLRDLTSAFRCPVATPVCGHVERLTSGLLASP